MRHQLRTNQQAFKQGIYDAWNRGARCVIGTMATGGGKTVTMGSMAAELPGRGVIEAHRSELVGQISQSLAREGIRHNITAPKKIVKTIVENHMDELARSFYDPRASWNVASVDTIIRRDDPMAQGVNWLFQDEGHHTLRENKWGRAAESYPNAKILLMTATPCRADGKGLGSHHDGIADAIVVGPSLKTLIAEGYLTNYEVHAPLASDLNMSDVHVTASGEFNQQEVARAVKRSRKIVGDVVENYLAKIPGKLAIVFAVDKEHAETITNAFNAAGVPAAFVHSETIDDDRRTIMKDFKARKLRVLVNVDLFGEGVDVPAVEAVIMARPTASFSLYAQQIGRMLRLFISEILMTAWDTYTVDQRLRFIAESEKPFGVLIDHVGNVYREYNVGGIKYTGLPEGFADWTLDRRTKRGARVSDDGIPTRLCLKCHKPYERIFDACPHCGTAAPEPADRSAPEFVDGAVNKLSPEVLARMRGEIARVDGPVYVPQNLPPHAVTAVRANHQERQRDQYFLREAIALWAGMYPQYSQTENERRFFHTFGLDVLSALTLGSKDAQSLTMKINGKVSNYDRPASTEDCARVFRARMARKENLRNPKG